ncbi:MAG: ABC transporter ATP-binding protein [Clostridium sp.]|nr:ABC transporter ATP-binding protein [Clostridium sp.]
MISLQHLTVGYGSRHLLEDAEAAFFPGRLVALIGRNGAGKSTLLRAMAGLESPISGKVAVAGIAERAVGIDEMPLPQRARAVAFVTTQKVRIPNMLCRDAVGMGRAPYTDWIGRLSAEDKIIVEQSLAMVGMEAFADKPLDRISDGECQRVMIARALAQDTPIMLLDEPTSFLDLPNRYELCSLLARLAHERGKTIIFSTHELDIALQLCDDIALIDSPRLITLPAAEMAAQGHIQRLFANTSMAFDPVAMKMVVNR